MTDVRALLAAEKSSRRVTHPYASYVKTGVLSCTACNLSIKSEALWEGHLKSANHRKNAARLAIATQSSSATAPHATTTKSLKRKIEDVDEEDDANDNQRQEVRRLNVDNGSKKPKSRATSAAESVAVHSKPRTDNANNSAKHVHFSPEVVQQDQIDDDSDNEYSQATPQMKRATNELPSHTVNGMSLVPSSSNTDRTSEPLQSHNKNSASILPQQQQSSTTVDEEEWLAFQSDMTALEESEVKPQPQPNSNSQYSAATITAAPVSAATLAAQKEEAESQRKKLLESEIEEEKEDEGRRIEEEFEVMEEMEERVRKLKEKRESLRATMNLQTKIVPISDSGKDGGKENGGESERVNHSSNDVQEQEVPNATSPQKLGESSSSDDDADDWYA